MRYPLSLYPAKTGSTSVWVAECTLLPILCKANTPFQALLDYQEAEDRFVSDAISHGVQLPDIPTKLLCDYADNTAEDEPVEMFIPDGPLTIYTDGACSGNPGPGGWAYIILSDGKEVVRGSGHENRTTNNRMEVTAFIEALKVIPSAHQLLLVSDSEYLIKTLAGTYSKKKNLDLWVLVDAAVEKHDVQFKWVRGHNGDQWNEVCDKLAVAESRRS